MKSFSRLSGPVRGAIWMILGGASLVGADLGVMDRDSRKMRGERPFVFAQLKIGDGVATIVDFIVEAGGLRPRGS